MKRETKVLMVLYILLLVALIAPIIPYPTQLYYLFPEYRPLTIIEYLRTLLIDMVIK